MSGNEGKGGVTWFTEDANLTFFFFACTGLRGESSKYDLILCCMLQCTDY